MDNKKETERAELHRTIWAIANDLRGSVDGWDFKQYVLGDVLLTIVGAIGRSAVVKTEQKMLFQRSVCVIKPKQDLLDSSYLKYIFDSKTVQNYIQRNAQGAAQKGIYLDSVKKIKIPLPSLTRQNEIVKILDRFEFLCNDISTGLPAEIKARHQQYEYYRDKLLSFKRKQMMCEASEG